MPSDVMAGWKKGRFTGGIETSGWTKDNPEKMEILKDICSSNITISGYNMVWHEEITAYKVINFDNFCKSYFDINVRCFCCSSSSRFSSSSPLFLFFFFLLSRKQHQVSMLFIQ